jgi:hypothetical protein
MKQLAIIFLLFYSQSIFGQQPLLFSSVQEIPIQNLDLVSFDTKDNLFLSSTTGDIFQFNSAGQQINLYSPERQGKLQQLEAAWTVNIFSFSADLQEYRILDRFLNPLSSSGFQLTDILLAKAATLGNNNIVWIWDESDFNLKSFDYLRKLVIQSQPLNLILKLENLEVTEIREFKNRLFLNVPSEGIFIFDNQANLIKKINLQTRQKLCLFREHLLWIQEGSIFAIALVNQQITNLGLISNTQVNALQMGQERMALIFKESIQLVDIPTSIKTLD